MSFTVVIAGRPNVGKSTLFNRLVGRRIALVDPTPGVTRDWRDGMGNIGPLTFRVIDTAGLEEADPGTLGARMREQTSQALAQADVMLFVVDARTGLTPEDTHFARELRRSGLPVILVANKAEGRAGEGGFFDAYSLGLGDPVAISAEHGEGLGDLYNALAVFAPEEDEERQSGEGAMKLAIVGRPNVGKSTLVNRLLGSERMITGPEAGLTRDSIAAAYRYEGRDIELVDTAGMRRKSRVAEGIERMSVSDTLLTIRYAHVVAVVVDATEAYDKQDLTIVDLIEREGRSPLVVVNKWDLVKDQKGVRQKFEDLLYDLLPQVKGAPLVTLSALSGRGVERLMPAVVEAYERWNARIPTSLLNRWLEDVLATHPPPVSGGGRIKLRYVSQAKSRPPTFTLHGTRVDDLPESYKRYLVNRMRIDFDLPGVPIRLRFKSPKNPYADK
ncbi:MAG: ribosome biogenesis GTPase Der [Proteobacteria bacterium]|nr:ribosome biogenesis GTPase Der [Pseudomonadota bacterium]